MSLEQIIQFFGITAGRVWITLFGGISAKGSYVGLLHTLTYVSATPIAIDAAAGNARTVAITDGVAWTVAAPINPPIATAPVTGSASPVYSQFLYLTIKNTSGGALGAGTFDAIYKMTSNTAPAIANGKNRTFAFYWDGTNWIQMFATAADVAN